jgi:hypothetical protein
MSKKRSRKRSKKRKQALGPRASVSGRVRTIKFACGLTGCTASPHKTKMNPGDVTVMLAMNTNVAIEFTAGSPFESGIDRIDIPKGYFHAELVGSAKGSYKYSLSCPGSACVTLRIPPEMIVE